MSAEIVVNGLAMPIDAYEVRSSPEAYLSKSGMIRYSHVTNEYFFIFHTDNWKAIGIIQECLEKQEIRYYVRQREEPKRRWEKGREVTMKILYSEFDNFDGARHYRLTLISDSKNPKK